MSDKKDAKQAPKKQLSIEDWNKISAGLSLSPDDLHMITTGLELLLKSQLELEILAKDQLGDTNLAECLKAWSERTKGLLDRVVGHHTSCVLKAKALQ